MHQTRFSLIIEVFLKSGHNYCYILVNLHAIILLLFIDNDQPLWEQFNFDDGLFVRAQAEAANETVKQFELKEVPQDDIKLIDILKRCKLKDLTEDIESVTNFKISCSFCEFKGELENISEDKEIIFMDEVIMALPIIPV